MKSSKLLVSIFVLLGMSPFADAAPGKKAPRELVDQCAQRALKISVTTMNEEYPATRNEEKGPFSPGNASARLVKALKSGQGDFSATYDSMIKSADGYECLLQVTYFLRVANQECFLGEIAFDHCAK